MNCADCPACKRVGDDWGHGRFECIITGADADPHGLLDEYREPVRETELQALMRNERTVKLDVSNEPEEPERRPDLRPCAATRLPRWARANVVRRAAQRGTLLLLLWMHRDDPEYCAILAEDIGGLSRYLPEADLAEEKWRADWRAGIAIEPRQQAPRPAAAVVGT